MTSLKLLILIMLRKRVVMISYRELKDVASRLTDAEFGREVAVFGNEVIATEKVADQDVGVVDRVILWVNTSTGDARILSTSPLDWPEWYVEDMESLVTLL